MADLVILAAPGMGVVDDTFAQPLFNALRAGLGDDWERLHCATIPCHQHLHTNVERVFEGMKKRDMDFLRARRFMLFGMAESAAQFSASQQKDDNYDRTQQAICQTLGKAAAVAGDSAPVILLTHSVSCATLSNYLWDAQQLNVAHGIWHDGGPRDVHKGSGRDLFLRLKTLSHWYTLGSTMPLWSAALPREQIQAVTTGTRGYSFRWKNFYHPDDLFGWPLKPLSSSYNQAVYRDYETSPLEQGGAAQWGPQLVAHQGYWQCPLVQEELLRDIRAQLQRSGAGALVGRRAAATA